MISLTGAPLRHPDALRRMAAALRHRGPDDPGVLRAADAAVGCERLRITDPRPEAAQPFSDPDGAVWLVLNGAIYNSVTLRKNHPAFPFRSRSDVEPVLPAYLAHGGRAVDQLDGMFALAIWDSRTRRLVLARDRAGEKPLFYFRWADEVWFASEVRALLCHPVMRFTEDREASRLFLALGYVPGARTGFRGVWKVEPGSVTTISDAGVDRRHYWAPESISQSRLDLASSGTEFGTLLRAAVHKQTAADVPVGVFSSGGVDSSLILAMASRERPIVSFSVGFPDRSYDESDVARFVAGRCSVRHITVQADERALTCALDTITDHLAEPLADPAILPTYLLARSARRHVGVVLGGEGADELFGGYPTYIGHRLAPWFSRIPSAVRRSLARVVGVLPASSAKVPLEFLIKRFLNDVDRPRAQRHLAWFGTGLLPLLAEPEAVIAQTLQAARCMPGVEGADDPIQATTLLDYRTYLADGLLVKVDRATMLCGLEARAPYLDRELSEYAFALPPARKVRGIATKRVLKRAALAYLPPAIVHRRKRGLSVPVATWLNGGLAPEVARLVGPDRAGAAGLLDSVRVRELAVEHRAGVANHARAIWALLVYHRWRQRWLGD